MGRHASGVSQDRLEMFKQMAGEGSLDERCRRILGHMWQEWELPEPMSQRRSEAA